MRGWESAFKQTESLIHRSCNKIIKDWNESYLFADKKDFADCEGVVTEKSQATLNCKFYKGVESFNIKQNKSERKNVPYLLWALMTDLNSQ